MGGILHQRHPLLLPLWYLFLSRFRKTSQGNTKTKAMEKRAIPAPGPRLTKLCASTTYHASLLGPSLGSQSTRDLGLQRPGGAAGPGLLRVRERGGKAGRQYSPRSVVLAAGQWQPSLGATGVSPVISDYLRTLFEKRGTGWSGGGEVTKVHVFSRG